VTFRDDVVFKPVWLGWQQGKHVYYTDPAVYADWCWRDASEFPGGDNGRIPAYKAELERQPVVAALGRFTDLMYRLTMLETSDVFPEVL